jgi:hypothetical protein
MVRYPEPRAVRRAAKKRAAAEKAAAKLAERAADLGARPDEDRRQAERRTEPLTGAALDRKLRELRVDHDRRAAERRKGGDRRRR